MRTYGSHSQSYFDGTRDQLERQTAALLAERKKLQHRGIPQSAAITPVVLQKLESRGQTPRKKTQQAIGKIQEIIRLCKEDGSLSNEELGQVLKVENQILHYLQNRGVNSEVAQDIRSLNVTKPDNNNQTQGGSTVNDKRLSARERFQQNSKVPLSDNTIELIEQIQRKALNEIAFLQEEKNKLLLQLQSSQPVNNISSYESERLREENRLLRQENAQLRNRIERQPQPRESLANQQYLSQINVYENELRRAQMIIQQLRQKIARAPQIYDLHEQGEQIRQGTVHLIRIKQGDKGFEKVVSNGEEERIIHELSLKLQEEQKAKQEFLQDLMVFKQKYRQLEEQNRNLRRSSKVTFDTSAKAANSVSLSNARSIIKKKGQSTSLPLSEYEQTINEMRRVVQN